MYITTIGKVCKDQFNQSQVRDFGNINALFTSTRPHCPHSAQIEGHANELELGFYLFQPTDAELAKFHNVFDSSVGWPGNPYARFMMRDSGIARQAYHLNKQVCELAQVQGKEIPYRAVDGDVLNAVHCTALDAERYNFMPQPDQSVVAWTN